jgi:glucose-6-phosphate dehydrogenase assembly protein OpcA
MQANTKRGYCQLEIGGKIRTLHFSMNFWAAFESAAGFSIAEIDKVLGSGLSLTTLRALIYAGILAYDQENKQPIDYDQFDVGAWMDDIDQSNIEVIINTLLESRILGNDLNAGVRRNVEKSTKNPKPKNP